ncbi:MAG TPA: universal stress protein [Casimicrobiaceae bacterium]|jgi:nucleotide-binding universal stress UspA family protein
MLTILTLIDGSENSSRAVRYVIELSAACKEAPDIQLLNVQPPVAPGSVARHVRRTDLDGYYHDEGMAALTSARELLDKAGIRHAFHIGVGEIGETVAKYVKELRVQQVAMGTRGLGPVAGMLLGSVTTKVVQAVNVPIVLVK